MQRKEEFTPLELIAATTPEGIVRSPRRSPRFQIETVKTAPHISNRISLPFSELRKNERRGSGTALLDRGVTVEQTLISGRVRRNSIIWPAKEDSQKEADKQLAESLNLWKHMRNHNDPNANIAKAVMDTLSMVEKYYIQGVVQFSDPEKPDEKGITYSLLSILESMYKCPAVQKVLESDYTLRSQFSSVNFVVRDYQSILAEANSIIKLIKKHHHTLDRIVAYFSKRQVEAVEEFAFVPFVRAVVSNTTVQDIFKSGMLKERDIPLFYQRLGMRKYVGLDTELAKSKMVELIVNPQTMQLIYGPVTIPMKNIISKEALEPLKHISDTLGHLESNLDMFSNEELELKINLTINPMGKIKEKLQLLIEDLIDRLVHELPEGERDRYHAIIEKILPSAKTSRRKNWIKAFELMSELAQKLK